MAPAGFYIQINYEADGHLIKALEKWMRFNVIIERHLTIKYNTSDSLKLAEFGFKTT